MIFIFIGITFTLNKTAEFNTNNYKPTFRKKKNT